MHGTPAATSPGEGVKSPANTSERTYEPIGATGQPSDDSTDLSPTARQSREELRTERAKFELQLRELQTRNEEEIDALKKTNVAELWDQRERYEDALRNQQARHQLTEDRLWSLVGKDKTAKSSQ